MGIDREAVCCMRMILYHLIMNLWLQRSRLTSLSVTMVNLLYLVRKQVQNITF